MHFLGGANCTLFLRERVALAGERVILFNYTYSYTVTVTVACANILILSFC